MSNLCSVPGFYIKLTKNVRQGKESQREDCSYLLPYSENFTISNEQKVVRPVEQFMKELKEFVLTNAEFVGGTLPAGVDLASNIQDIFGYHLGTKWYYASAWAGEEPAQFSINLKFYRGMAGLWSAKDEVYDPSIGLYRCTIPQESDDGLSIISPMTTPFGAFSQYSDSILQGIEHAFSTGATKISEKISAIASHTSVKESMIKDIMSISKALGVSIRTWKVSFGWCNGNSADFVPYYSIDNCICKNSSISFGTQVEKENINAKPYPINSEIKLSFISQTIMTNKDIGKL